MTDALPILWSLIEDPAALRKCYDLEAKSRPEFALAMARFDALVRDDADSDVVEEVAAALSVERAPVTVWPLLVARALAATEVDTLAELFIARARTVPAQAIPALRALIKKAKDNQKVLAAKKKTQPLAQAWANFEDALVFALAHAGDSQLAVARLGTDPSDLPPLIETGVQAAIDAGVAWLEKNTSEDEDDLRVAADLLGALANAKVEAAVPAMLRYLRSGIFIHAFDALERMGDRRAIEPTRAILRETCGESWWSNMLRLCAEYVLRRHGESFPLDLARASVLWPIVGYKSNEPEALRLRAIAISTLGKYGTAKDKASARAHVRSVYRVVREAALVAWDSPPDLVAWDAGRVAWAKKNGGTKALLAALDEPNAIFLDTVVKGLADVPAAKGALASFIVSEFERRLPFPYDEDVDLDADLQVFAEVGEALAEGSAKKVFAASKSPWVKVKILGVAEDEVSPRAAIEESALPLDRTATVTKKLEVTRFDTPPNVFARGVTMLALAQHAERLLVVGPDACVLDPQRAVRIVSLDGAGVSCAAIAEDGCRVALARGGEVTIYETDGGAVVRRIETPERVSAVAFSPDGSCLAIGGGAAGRVVAIENGAELIVVKAPGPIRAAAWLGPGRAIFLADKAKKSALVDVDVAKKKVAEVAVAPSTLLATRRKLIFTAGANVVRVHDAKLATKRELECPSPVLDLGIENEKVAVIRLAERLERVSFGGKAPRHESIGSHEPSHMAASGGRIYIDEHNTVFGVHDDETSVAAAGVHFNHVGYLVAASASASTSTGALLSCGWDGRLLSWNFEGGVADTLFEQKDERLTLTLSPDGTRAYVTERHNLHVVDLATRKRTALFGGDDIEPDIAEAMSNATGVAATSAHVAWIAGDGAHLLDGATGSEIAQIPIDEPECIVASDDGAYFYVGTDKGALVCFDTSGAVVWSRIEHGVDVLKGELYGDPHRTCAALATRGKWLASLSSDDTVRVFDGPKGTRTLRCYTGVGIFNDLAFSPSGKRLAFTYGRRLEIRELPGGGVVGKHEWSDAETMGVTFADEDTLFVGSGHGAIYRVMLR